MNETIYTGFASVYDILMSETPYIRWSEQIHDWIGRYGISKSGGQGGEADLLVDLGCGTGTLTELLSEMGYDCIGIDCSPDMLMVAVDKKSRSGSGILYLCQDMRRLELYGTAGTIISVCDSLNYLLREEDLLDTFRRVNNYLHPGGIFIFDFNTVYKYQTVIGNATIAEDRDACSFIWENDYHEQEQINEYKVTFFVRERGDRYRRFQETHYQRGYTLGQMTNLLEQAGLRYIAAFDGEDGGDVRKDSGRICILAGESGKTVE